MRSAWVALWTLPLVGAVTLPEAVERGALLEQQRQWREAASVYEAALSERNAPGEARLWLLTSVGEMYFNEKDYRRARQWIAEAQKVFEATLPHSTAARLRFLNARAALQLVEGRVSAAQQSLLQATLYCDPPAARSQVAAVYHNLASVEMQTGNLSDAEIHERKALAMWTEELGPHHESVMRAWIGLSSVQGLRRDWHSAETSLREALRIAETPEAYSNLAVVLDRLRRGAEARQIRKRLLSPIVANASLIDVRTKPRQDSEPGIVVH